MRRATHSLMVILITVLVSSCRKPVVGCMDAAYDNYNPEANEDDGCCCTIVIGPSFGTRTRANFLLPFPNAPDTLSPLPTFELQASIFRDEYYAQGPCGCLYSGVGDRPRIGEYSPSSGDYAPRATCNTYFGWSGNLSTSLPDTTYWNLLKSANGIESAASRLVIAYAVHFEAAALEGISLQFSDTTPTYVSIHPQNPGGPINVVWAGGISNSYVPRHSLSGDDLPCTDYPLDSASVIFELQGIELLP
jgi:hypothetical protein